MQKIENIINELKSLNAQIELNEITKEETFKKLTKLIIQLESI